MELTPTSKDFQIFVQGMNTGYAFAKYLPPEIADSIAKSKNYSTWFEGFRCGKTEYEHEKNQDKERSNDNKDAASYRPKFLTDRFNETDPYMKNPDREKQQTDKNAENDKDR